MINDKILHFLATLIITVLFGQINIIIGIFASLIASFGKELYDEYTYGGWDWKDIVADLFGIVIGILCLASFGG